MTNPVWFGGDGCMQQRGAKFEGRERFGWALRRLNSDFENIEHEINQNMKYERNIQLLRYRNVKV